MADYIKTSKESRLNEAEAVFKTSIEVYCEIFKCNRMSATFSYFQLTLPALMSIDAEAMRKACDTLFDYYDKLITIDQTSDRLEESFAELVKTWTKQKEEFNNERKDK